MNYFDKYKVIGICGGAWGDEGKGKFTDYFAQNADVIIRAQGGNNAGHTVKADGKTLKLHVVPSGIIYTDKLNIIGNGVVLDIFSIVDNEIEVLKKNNIFCENLMISSDSHVIFPYHRLMDFARSYKKIGTTAKGIGPCYSDKINRNGIKTGELYNKEVLEVKLKENCEYYNKILKIYDIDENELKDFINKSNIDDVCNNMEIDFELLLKKVNKYANIIKKYVRNHKPVINKAIDDGKNVLIEGAQGLLLDIDHGTYPYVTSSNACAGGFSTGTGISPEKIDKIFSVTGAYLTRVGNGPFPSELGEYSDIKDENSKNRLSLEQCKELISKNENDLDLGKAIRHIAGEFGTTTGRPRRTGWLDICVLKYIAGINGKDIIITKFDIFDHFDEIKVLKNYRFNSDNKIYWDGQDIKKGDIIEEFPVDDLILRNLVPGEYISFKGWKEDTTAIKEYSEMPKNAKRFLDEVEKLAGVNIRIVSNGPSREQAVCIK